MATATKPKTYISDFSVTFRGQTVKGRLVPIRRTVESDVKLCSPEGGEVWQRYIDGNGKTYEFYELERAIVDEDGNYRLVDKDELKRARQSSLENNVMNITVHTRQDAEQWLYPSEHNAYIFEPVIMKSKRPVHEPDNDKMYNIIQAIVDSGKYAVVALACIRGSEALYRLVPYKGYIAVQRQLYPEDLWQTYEEYSSQLDRTQKKKALLGADSSITPFNPEDYINEVRGRIETVKSEDFVPGSKMSNDPTESSVDDLLDGWFS